MKLGFIGTGKITLSVVTGICTSKISFQRILVYKGNKEVSRTIGQLDKSVIYSNIKKGI